MRRFIAVFVATVAGLVVLLSFKTTSAKSPPPAALSGAVPGVSSAPPADSAPDDSSPVSAPASSGAVSSAPASSAASSTTASSAASTSARVSPTAKGSPTPTKSGAKSTPKPTPKPTLKPSNTTKTVTGSAITVGEGRRIFGVVQVQLTLTNGKITAATAIQSPQNDGHSADLSSYSIPKLNREVLAAQSASIDAVSGATYTSDAYAQSVQAALDAAKA